MLHLTNTEEIMVANMTFNEEHLILLSRNTHVEKVSVEFTIQVIQAFTSGTPAT
ncbi:MAG: hypothetical protein ACRCS6_03795 [Turicibacter sp.]